MHQSKVDIHKHISQEIIKLITYDLTYYKSNRVTKTTELFKQVWPLQDNIKHYLYKYFGTERYMYIWEIYKMASQFPEINDPCPQIVRSKFVVSFPCPINSSPNVQVRNIHSWTTSLKHQKLMYYQLRKGWAIP